jgi:hypothetical protein
MGMPGTAQQPAAGAKTIQLILRNDDEAQRASQWLQAMGMSAQLNGSRVLSVANSGEDIAVLTRMATAFGLEMNNYQSTSPATGATKMKS